MNISAVVAVDKYNFCIGKDGKVPWKIPSDMKNFRNITSGGTVIMGRKTYESIPKKFRPLPNRRNIVLTSNKSWSEEGVSVAHNLQHCIGMLKSKESAFVIGGGEVYREFLPFCKFLYISYIDTKKKGRLSIDGDAFFPNISQYAWPICINMDFQFDGDEYPYVLSVHRNINFDSTFDIEEFESQIVK